METNELGMRAKKQLVDLARKIDERLEKYWESELEKRFGFNGNQKVLVEKMLRHARVSDVEAFIIWKQP